MIQFIKKQTQTSSTHSTIKTDAIVESATAPVNNFLPFSKGTNGKYTITVRQICEVRNSNNINYNKNLGYLYTGELIENTIDLPIISNTTNVPGSIIPTVNTANTLQFDLIRRALGID